MAGQIHLHVLAKAEQQRVLEGILARHRTRLIDTYPNVVDVSWGVRCRHRRLHNRKGLVLKFWVRSKTGKPRVPVRESLPYRCKARLRPGAVPKWVTVLVPTDVLPLSRGTLLAKSAAINCSYRGGRVRGCLAARVLWRDGKHAWLSAAHVLTVYSTSRDLNTVGTVEYQGREIGRAIRETCWCTEYRSELRMDAGLVEEQYVGPIDAEWTACVLSEALPPEQVSMGDRCSFMNQLGEEVPIQWHCWVPGGTHTFEMAPGIVRSYPRFLHFTGSAAPGDSGTAVYKNVGRGKRLVGVLIGGVNIDGLDGVAVIPFQDIVDALYMNHEYTMTLSPFVI